MPLPTLAFLAAVNFWSFASFGVDKQRARKGGWRIPERDLLVLALIGGSAGAFLGRRRFRHKTRKQPFSTYLTVIAVMQAGGVMGWLVAT